MILQPVERRLLFTAGSVWAAFHLIALAVLILAGVPTWLAATVVADVLLAVALATWRLGCRLFPDRGDDRD